MCIGSLGVACSYDLPSLLFWRFLQTFGCSGGIAIGAAVIGDIYKLEERGAALGSFFGVSLLVSKPVARAQLFSFSPRYLVSLSPH